MLKQMLENHAYHTGKQSQNKFLRLNISMQNKLAAEDNTGMLFFQLNRWNEAAVLDS